MPEDSNQFQIAVSVLFVTYCVSASPPLTRLSLTRHSDSPR